MGILVYHKFSTFLCMVMFVVNLLYQRFGAILMSRHRFMKLFYLKNQAFSTVMLVGKLSNITDEAVQKYIKEQAEETRKEESRGTAL